MNYELRGAVETGKVNSEDGKQFRATVPSPKLIDGVFLTAAVFSEPRQGRKIVAQGVSPGLDDPHPAFGTPLPLERERGWR